MKKIVSLNGSWIDEKNLNEMEAGLMVVIMDIGRLLTYQRQVRH